MEFLAWGPCPYLRSPQDSVFPPVLIFLSLVTFSPPFTWFLLLSETYLFYLLRSAICQYLGATDTSETLMTTMGPLPPPLKCAQTQICVQAFGCAETLTPQIKDLCFKAYDLNSSSASVASHPFPSEAFFYQCFSPSCHVIHSFSHSLIHLLTCTPIILLGTKD